MRCCFSYIFIVPMLLVGCDAPQERVKLKSDIRLETQPSSTSSSVKSQNTVSGTFGGLLDAWTATGPADAQARQESYPQINETPAQQSPTSAQQFTGPNQITVLEVPALQTPGHSVRQLGVD